MIVTGNSTIGGGGVIGQSSLGPEVSSASPSLGGYDPIKSLLNQFSCGTLNFLLRKKSIFFFQQEKEEVIFWKIYKKNTKFFSERLVVNKKLFS